MAVVLAHPAVASESAASANVERTASFIVHINWGGLLAARLTVACRVLFKFGKCQLRDAKIKPLVETFDAATLLGYSRLCVRARRLGSRSLTGKVIATPRPVYASLHVGSIHLPYDRAIIALTNECAIPRDNCLERRSRIAWDVGVRHRVAELSVRNRNDRLARRFAPISSLGFRGSGRDANCRPV